VGRGCRCVKYEIADKQTNQSKRVGTEADKHCGMVYLNVSEPTATRSPGEIHQLNLTSRYPGIVACELPLMSNAADMPFEERHVELLDGLTNPKLIGLRMFIRHRPYEERELSERQFFKIEFHYYHAA
jgi:hypothetical protein